MKVRVKNLQYDLDGTSGFESYGKGRTRKEVLSSLPDCVDLVLPQEVLDECMNEEEFGGREPREDWIQEEIEENQGWLVIGFEYEFMGQTFRFLDDPHYSVLFNLIRKRKMEEDS